MCAKGEGQGEGDGEGEEGQGEGEGRGTGVCQSEDKGERVWTVWLVDRVRMCDVFKGECG